MPGVQLDGYRLRNNHSFSRNELVCVVMFGEISAVKILAYPSTRPHRSHILQSYPDSSEAVMPDSIAQYAVTLLSGVPIDAPYKYPTECILSSFASKRAPDSKFPNNITALILKKSWQHNGSAAAGSTAIEVR